MKMNAMSAAIGTGVALALLSAAGAANAKKSEKTQSPAPQAYEELIKCRQIVEPAARLACFDLQTGKLEQATSAGEVVISDRQSINEARRGLFGFRLPSIKLFGGGDDDAQAIQSIDSTVSSARQFGYGTWRVTLADGSVWEQVDDQRLVFDPASGDKAHIYKGAMGTYRMNIAGQRAIKVRRVE